MKYDEQTPSIWDTWICFNLLISNNILNFVVIQSNRGSYSGHRNIVRAAAKEWMDQVIEKLETIANIQDIECMKKF